MMRTMLGGEAAWDARLRVASSRRVKRFMKIRVVVFVLRGVVWGDE